MVEPYGWKKHLIDTQMSFSKRIIYFPILTRNYKECSKYDALLYIKFLRLTALYSTKVFS